MRIEDVTINRDKQQIRRARRLRRSMTDGERRLWRELRLFKGSYGIHVRRQVPICNFVVDFAVIGHNLVIELDGEHHFTVDGMARDAARDAKLAALGYRVLRITTGELDENLDGCIETILRELGVT